MIWPAMTNSIKYKNPTKTKTDIKGIQSARR